MTYSKWVKHMVCEAHLRKAILKIRQKPTFPPNCCKLFEDGGHAFPHSLPVPLGAGSAGRQETCVTEG